MANKPHAKPLPLLIGLSIVGLVLGVISTWIAKWPLFTTAHFYMTVIDVVAMWATWLVMMLVIAARKRMGDD